MEVEVVSTKTVRAKNRGALLQSRGAFVQRMRICHKAA